MHLLYNNHFIPEQDFTLHPSNRAFQFNDGFFETVMVVDGALRFWQDHKDRMQEASETLRLELPAYFFSKAVEETLLALALKNNLQQHGRLKLKCWRAGAGLYTPATNEIDWLATIQTANKVPDSALQVGVCKRIKTIYSPFSHFKGPNSLVYVVASQEKLEFGFDDMLLLDQQDNVAELTSSNIFWLKDDVLYTSPLDTGCVNGIVRRNISRWCQASGVDLMEAHAPVETLLQADALYAANVTGIRELSHLAKQSLLTNPPFYAWLQTNFQQATL
ncbi:aminotransferase class IV [Pontibacter sp. MBLB2868]|uniref:aminotransferase class IV n=1 Tax=Pontibacter sp. MBLB2868 TaxID=3451555 RepID=UPI003F753277